MIRLKDHNADASCMNGNGLIYKVLSVAILAILGGGAGFSLGNRSPSDAVYKRLETVETRNVEITHKLAAIEATLTEVKSSMGRVERLLDRITERKQP